MKKRKKRLSNDSLAAVVFLAPNIIGFFTFIVGPIIVSFVISTLNWNMLTDAVFVGFKNYIDLFTSQIFIKVLLNTFYFMLGTVPAEMLLALVFALLLNQKIKGITIFRTIYFLPVISSMIAVALLWRWIYMDGFGLLPYLVSRAFGVAPPRFLSSEDLALPSIMVMSVWKRFGHTLVLFLAGLQGVSSQYYEAAEIDGASVWQKIISITLPMLSPTTFFILIMSIINSFQIFEQAYILTQGGPNFATTTIVYYIYQTGFLNYKMGLASAMAWVLFIIVLAFTLLQWKMEDRWVHYD